MSAEEAECHSPQLRALGRLLPTGALLFFQDLPRRQKAGTLPSTREIPFAGRTLDSSR